MKKLCVVLIAVLLLFNMTAISGFAVDNIEYVVNFNAEENSYVISGYVNYDRDRIPMTLMLEQNGNLIAIEETLAKGISDRGVAFTFPKIILTPTTHSGDINFEIFTSYEDFIVNFTENYSGVDIKFDGLYQINNALKTGSADDLKAKIVSTASALGVNESLFSSLSDSSKTIALKYMSTLNIEIEEEFTNVEECYDTEEECYAISQQVENYQKHYREAIALASFFNCTSTSDLKGWYNTYKSQYGFLEDDESTTINEETLLSYFDEAITFDGYILRLNNINYVENLSELNIQMKNQAVLQKIQDSNMDVVRRVLEELPELLTNVTNREGNDTTSLNYAGWNSVKSLGKASNLCVAIAGKNYATIYDFVVGVNNEIVNIINSGGGITERPNNSEGSTSGSKKGSGGTINVPVDAINTSANTITFNDITHVSWAKEAITYLYEKGVVSGKNASTFAPDDNVTRAELLKMLVTGFGLKGSNNATFTDVSQNAWYAQYVGIGQANNVINGDAQGKFNPDKPVSRQDATVMMYRIINASSNGKTANFTDYNKIAEYAKDAVNYMYSNGIIDGVGDGKFAPSANLTRAQAAKMIHKLLTN